MRITRYKNSKRPASIAYHPEHRLQTPLKVIGVTNPDVLVDQTTLKCDLANVCIRGGVLSDVRATTGDFVPCSVENRPPYVAGRLVNVPDHDDAK